MSGPCDPDKTLTPSVSCARAGRDCFPTQIALLTKLSRIRFRMIGLTGTLPSELWGMKSENKYGTFPLELALGGNQLSGTIPTELFGVNTTMLNSVYL